MPDLILQSEAVDELRETVVRIVDAAGAGLGGMDSAATIKISKPGTAAYGAAGSGTALVPITGGADGGDYRFILGAGDANAVGDVMFEISHASINGGAVHGYVSVRPKLRTVDLADNMLTDAKVAADAKAAIATANWAALVADNLTAGSFGDLVAFASCMISGNYMVDTITDGSAVGLLTVARIRAWLDAAAAAAATPGHANDADGEDFRLQFTSVDAGGGLFTSAKRVRTL